MRMLALTHLFEGKSRYQIAEYLKVSRTSVNKYHKGLKAVVIMDRAAWHFKDGLVEGLENV